MTTDIVELHNVSWALMPHNNNRTAWRPFGLPMVLIEPHRRNAQGNPLSNSNVVAVRIAIESVPREALVAGHDHVGLRFPDQELYIREVSTLEIYDRQIEPEAQSFFKIDGTPVDFEDAETGDLMQIGTISGIIDTITYIRSANYYDLSDITLETEGLSPSTYTFSYQADYYVRVISRTDSGELLCIDGSRIATSVYRMTINHPGDVMEETTRLTPQVYLDAESSRSEDKTLELYRPFTDILQDIFDEQNLLQSVNWVDRIPPQFIPYLAYLLGLDIPFFPQSLDSLRRTMLRNIVRLQQLKGSKRALVELFDLLGFATYWINLYWTADGSRLIRPGQTQPPEQKDNEIQIVQLTQIEPLLADYDTDGFGELIVPLLYRPSSSDFREGIATVVEDGDVIIDSFLVQKESAAYTALLAIFNDMNAAPSTYGDTVGNLPTVSGAGIEGYSQVIVEGQEGLGTEDTQVGAQPPFAKEGITLDRGQNIIHMTFSRSILFSQPNQLDSRSGPGLALFSFATYDRQDRVVPAGMEHLQSNRFDVQILTRVGESISTDVLDFLVDFLFKLKAFHSLLNVIIYSLDLNEVYQVTDFCVGGDFYYRFDTDAGQLQTPPAIIPGTPDEDGCYADPADLGYSDDDIILRSRIRDVLDENFESWKDLDARAGSSQDGDVRIEPIIGTTGGTCQFTSLGQDRILSDGETEANEIEYGPGPNSANTSVGSQSNLHESPISQVDAGSWQPTGADTSTARDSKGYGSAYRDYSVQPDQHCELDGFSDYCYKGRVDDELLSHRALFYTEQFRSHACRINIGVGLFYTYPALDKHNDNPYLDSVQGDYLSAYGALSPGKNHWLGRLLRAYGSPQDHALYYYNRAYADCNVQNKTHYLAIQRPELDIELSYMHFPGTRFASMGKLLGNFIHPAYRAKPWDDLYSFRCGPDAIQCGGGPSYLEAKLVRNQNGDWTLSYIDTPYVILGTGELPDIPGLGDHTLGSYSLIDDYDVIHSVFISDYNTGHSAITLDQTGPCDATDGGEGIYIGGGILSVDEPVFLTASLCDTGSYRDFCGGYAYQFGYQDLGDLDVDRGGTLTDFLDAAGVPHGSNPTDTQILFLMISGIRDGTSGYRFGCGCSVSDCDGTASTNPSGPLVLGCNADLFIDQSSSRDYNADQLVFTPSLVLEDTIGVHNYLFDGEIESLFELAPEGILSLTTRTITDWWWDSIGGFDRTGVYTARFGTESDGSDRNIGMLFSPVDVEAGSTITTSYLRFKASQNGSFTTVSVTITAYDSDSPSAPTSGPEAENRARISKTISWSNVPVWYAGTWYQSIDITDIVQRLVDRDGWQSGNSIALNIENNSSTVDALRYTYMRGSGFSPELVIGYRRPF